MSALFGSKKQEPQRVQRMPLPDDEQAKQAAARSRQSSLSRTGRASTILSRRGTSEAGTTSYSNSLLGSMS